MLRYSTCRSCQCLIRPNHWIERLVLFRNRVLLRMKVNRIVKWFVERAIRTRDTYQLNKSKVVQRCLYSYRQRYSPSQWSKCCGFRRCSEQFLPREAKNIKHVWFYPHGLARRISHQNFPANTRKRMTKPLRDGVCSAVSSPCAAGLSRPKGFEQ